MNNHATSANFDEEVPVTQEDLDAGRLVRRQRGPNGQVLPLEESVTLSPKRPDPQMLLDNLKAQREAILAILHRLATQEPTTALRPMDLGLPPGQSHHRITIYF